jgi:hypothetical protein
MEVSEHIHNPIASPNTEESPVPNRLEINPRSGRDVVKNINDLARNRTLWFSPLLVLQ